MRVPMLLLAGATVATGLSCFAQQGALQSSQSAAGPTVWSGPSGRDRSALPPGQGSRANECYTMRTYYFERRDGGPPRYAGSTTCTPADRAQWRAKLKGPGTPGHMFMPLGRQAVGEER